MATDIMCSFSNKGGGGARLNSGYRAHISKDIGQKRVMLTCPVCRRRMVGWAMVDHDGELVGYRIPPHKRKKWWKVGKPRLVEKRHGQVRTHR